MACLTCLPTTYLQSTYNPYLELPTYNLSTPHPGTTSLMLSSVPLFI